MRAVDVLERVLVPVVLLAVGVVVVQSHAIPYWQGAMGPVVGVLGSLGAELVGLYLVYQPGRLPRCIGLLLVGLMVLVPAWVICGPEYRAWREAERAMQDAVTLQAQAPVLLEALAGEIASVEASLREDEAKSATRAGWLGELERQRHALTELRTERRRLLAARDAPPPAGYDAWQAVPTVLPVVGLLLAFQLVNAYAALRVSGYRHGQGVPVTPHHPPREPVTHPQVTTPAPAVTSTQVTTPEPPVTPQVTSLRAEPVTPPRAGNHPPQEPVTNNRLPPPPVTSNHLSELELKRLLRIVQQGIREHGLNGLARRVKVNKRYLWLLANHEVHTREGKATLSEAALAKLAQHFLEGAGRAAQPG
jgi:hypothetical protein